MTVTALSEGTLGLALDTNLPLVADVACADLSLSRTTSVVPISQGFNLADNP